MSALDPERVRSYTESIYASILKCADTPWIVGNIQQHIDNRVGSPEWIEASRQALARFKDTPPAGRKT
jgi:hypothetical protein